MDTKYFYFRFTCGQRFVLSAVTGLLIGVFSAGSVRASDLDEEIRFIEALQQMRMPDIAEDVIAEARKRFPASEYPEAAPRLKVCEIQGLLTQGKFADVQKMIDAMADKNSAEYWALFLSMADAYYMYGEYAEADKRYVEFFKKIEKPPAALVTFYRDSAYKYAQMLLALERDNEALAAYRHLFKIPLEEMALRQVQADVAELLIKLAPAVQKKEDREAMLKEAEGLADKLLWKQDIWFGKAIVTKAHVKLLRGDLKGAQGLVESYMQQLKIIHDSLAKDDPDGSQGMLRMSPMPQCRYLLAELFLKEAQAEIKKGDGANDDRIKDLLLGERDLQAKGRKQNGAMQHFINVFLRFPESQWAADAGERSELIRKLVKERYQTDINIPVPPDQMKVVREKQFFGVQLLFRQNQFKEAAERYLAVLNQFPEFAESVVGLGDLAITYIELSDKDPDAVLMAEMVTGHLSERFADRPDLMRDAGDQVRRIGEYYGERRMEEQRRETYALFFRDYPEHYAASQLIMSFGEREFEGGNLAGAGMYYQQVADAYTNSPYYFDALSRLAQIQKMEGNPLGEIAALEDYAAKLVARGKPSHALLAGKIRLAGAQREYAGALLKGASAEGGDNETPEPGDAAATLLAAQTNAVAWLAKALAGLDEVVKCLNDAPNDYQVNDKEKQDNVKLKEMATFMRAVCLAQLQYPPEERPALRKAATDAYEEYVRLYPKGEFAPRALLQIGTLYTVLKDVNAAQAAFEKLRKEHKESDEAKNAVPMLADSLIKMGLRAEGIDMYRKMFQEGGTYLEGQFMAAAKALEEEGEDALALQAYDKVMSLTKEQGMTAAAKLGRARVLAAQKNYADARALLAEFIKEYAKLVVMVDANFLLVDVASKEGMLEPNAKARTDLFNMAVEALRMIRRYYTTIEQQKEVDLKVGEVLMRKMEAEKKFGTDVRVTESRGQAIVAFNNIIDTTDPGNAKLATVLEKAYFYTLPLMLEHKAHAHVIESCETYLRIFPAGRYRTEVQNWMNQAEIGQ